MPRRMKRLFKKKPIEIRNLRFYNSLLIIMIAVNKPLHGHCASSGSFVLVIHFTASQDRYPSSSCALV